MTILEGDKVIEARSSDGRRIAMKAKTAIETGDYATAARTSDGVDVALAFDPMTTEGQAGIIALTSDGKRVGLVPIGGLVLSGGTLAVREKNQDAFESTCAEMFTNIDGQSWVEPGTGATWLRRVHGYGGGGTWGLGFVEQGYRVYSVVGGVVASAHVVVGAQRTHQPAFGEFTQYALARDITIQVRYGTATPPTTYAAALAYGTLAGELTLETGQTNPQIADDVVIGAECSYLVLVDAASGLTASGANLCALFGGFFPEPAFEYVSGEIETIE